VQCVSNLVQGCFEGECLLLGLLDLASSLFKGCGVLKNHCGHSQPGSWLAGMVMDLRKFIPGEYQSRVFNAAWTWMTFSPTPSKFTVRTSTGLLFWKRQRLRLNVASCYQWTDSRTFVVNQ
jgi:hypothetical protein